MTIPFDLVYLLPLLVSAITSLNAFRLGWPVAMKLFSVFLFTTLSVEIFAVLWKYQWHSTRWWDYSPNNLWLYNIYLFPQYMFYIYFFNETLKLKSIKSYVTIIAVLFGLLSLSNLLFVQRLFSIDYFTIIAANLIMIFFSILYFILLMKAETVVKLSVQPLLWISIGTFIFHLGSLPCFILYNSIFSENMAVASSLFRIIVSLNFIMYFFYAIAFICTKIYPKSPY